MKINKNEFQDRPFACYAEKHIEKVIFPFIPQINSRMLNVYFAWKNDFIHPISADWHKYALILFNIV